jgi:hypothetical protein
VDACNLYFCYSLSQFYSDFVAVKVPQQIVPLTVIVLRAKQIILGVHLKKIIAGMKSSITGFALTAVKSKFIQRGDSDGHQND